MQMHRIFGIALAVALATTAIPALAAGTDASQQGVIKVAAAATSDAGSANAEKRACDAKWTTYKTEKNVHGWKAYFTFMADCM